MSSAFNREKNIDVKRSNYSVIGSEFDNMRDRFDNEMKRVEDEMARLRREFEGYTPPMHNMPPSHHIMSSSAPPPIAQHQFNTSSSSNYSSSNQQDQLYRNGNPRYYGNVATTGGGLPASTVLQRPTYDPYLDNLKSPLIKDESDGKTLRLRFNVSQYSPEEVTVKTVDNRLLVHAKHEEKSPQRTVYREYNQEFMLPRGTNPETITSTLSTDGVLTVEAPLPVLAIQQH